MYALSYFRQNATAKRDISYATYMYMLEKGHRQYKTMLVKLNQRHLLCH